MNPENIDPKFLAQFKKLEEKYDSMGQDVSSYLDGLLYSKYLHYADYIQLETLLSLQRPRTDIPDELIFIIYHQITELYFKLVNWELKQVADCKQVTDVFLQEKVSRLVRYFDNLIHSYDVMTKGMEMEQFMHFRMALLPASGFQSFQFRLIEIYCTDLYNLVDAKYRESLSETPSIEILFEHLYWKHGAQELSSGKKTLTLKQFEEKYTRKLLRNANMYSTKNLWQVVKKLAAKQELSTELKTNLRDFDKIFNVDWQLVHYRTASKYLDKKPEVLEATGGTNWHKYLPPRFQKKMFFPDLWSKEEVENWGKF
ncbi:MAG: tryptophan 2,3-dioxygenase [Bacteroidetes bacterium]|nr:MAG: tryptophan 2,3-dioxygenase [Bacteroidota bacterium]